MKIKDSLVYNRVGRPDGFRYCCRVAKILDMLLGFMRDCHAPMDDAAYIFAGEVPEVPWEPKELIKYKDTFVLQTTGVHGQTVRFVLIPEADHDSVEFQRLFEEAHAESLHANDVTLAKGLTVRGAGSLTALVEKIRKYHDSVCPKRYTWPPVVRRQQSRLVSRGRP